MFQHPSRRIILSVGWLVFSVHMRAICTMATLELEVRPWIAPLTFYIIIVLLRREVFGLSWILFQITQATSTIGSLGEKLCFKCCHLSSSSQNIWGNGQSCFKDKLLQVSKPANVWYFLHYFTSLLFQIRSARGAVHRLLHLEGRKQLKPWWRAQQLVRQNYPSTIYCLTIVRKEYCRLSVFRGSAWEWSELRGQFYYHAFTKYYCVCVCVCVCVCHSHSIPGNFFW